MLGFGSFKVESFDGALKIARAPLVARANDSIADPTLTWDSESDNLVHPETNPSNPPFVRLAEDFFLILLIFWLYVKRRNRGCFRKALPLLPLVTFRRRRACCRVSDGQLE